MAPLQPAAPFATSQSGFLQEAPVLGNQYSDDAVLRGIVRRYIPDEAMLRTMEEDLTRLGGRVVTEEMLEMVARAEVELPRLEQYDAFGKRVDKLYTSEGWRYMKPIAAEEGIVAAGYERERWREHARLLQFAKMYIYSPSSALFTCPLAMTDGAARVLELLASTPAQKDALKRLLSRDPKSFWTAGQWMTERPGGSDVSNSETQAVRQSDGSYAISGFKWFSSATDSDMAVLLARDWRSPTGETTPGSPGLSLFFAPMRKNGKLNGIRINRLKNKLGTKPLPTAELELDNLRAELIGPPGRGTATIAPVLNITRAWTAISACSFLRRGLAIARDYALKRRAFGKPIGEHPMHAAALAKSELQLRGINQLGFYVCVLLGRSEWAWYNKAPKDGVLLRLLTPVAKVFAARVAVQELSECMEALGGQGYIEDVGIARLWRDAMVLQIWEGASNVLALDVFRVILKDPEAIGVYCEAMEGLVEEQAPAKGGAAAVAILDSVRGKVREALGMLKKGVAELSKLQPRDMERTGRDLLFTIARITCAALLRQQAVWSVSRGDPEAVADLAAVRRWCAGREEWGGKLVYGLVAGEALEEEDRALGLGSGRARL